VDLPRVLDLLFAVKYTYESTRTNNFSQRGHEPDGLG
jgi:hypothetical protein